jgi:hypothetical protein
MSTIFPTIWRRPFSEAVATELWRGDFAKRFLFRNAAKPPRRGRVFSSSTEQAEIDPPIANCWLVERFFVRDHQFRRNQRRWMRVPIL